MHCSWRALCAAPRGFRRMGAEVRAVARWFRVAVGFMSLGLRACHPITHVWRARAREGAAGVPGCDWSY